jgi:hypothetical protein
MAGITDFMTEYLFMGSCSISLLGNMDIMCVDTWWLNGFFAENKASFKTIEAAFDASVRAATHFFREDGWEGRNVREHTSPGGTKGLLLGQVHETTICMIINLPWLIPPAALCSITILLLGATLVTNHLDRRQPVWKSSILPLPFYGLDEKSQNGGEESSTFQVYEMRAFKHISTTTVVKFQLGDNLTKPHFTSQDVTISDGHEMQSEAYSLLERRTNMQHTP